MTLEDRPLGHRERRVAMLTMSVVFLLLGIVTTATLLSSGFDADIIAFTAVTFSSSAVFFAGLAADADRTSRVGLAFIWLMSSALLAEVLLAFTWSFWFAASAFYSALIVVVFAKRRWPPDDASAPAVFDSNPLFPTINVGYLVCACAIVASFIAVLGGVFHLDVDSGVRYVIFWSYWLFALAWLVRCARQYMRATQLRGG